MLYKSEQFMLPITTFYITCHKHVILLYQYEAKISGRLNVLQSAHTYNNIIILKILFLSGVVPFLRAGHITNNR